MSVKVEIDLELLTDIAAHLAGKEKLIYQMAQGYTMSDEDAQVNGSFVNTVRKHLANSARYEIKCNKQLTDAEKQELYRRFTW